MPPRPATAASNAPPSEATCTPSTHVVVEVAQVHERGFRQVVVGQVEVPDLGRHHGLDARGQRRVAHRQALVVLEVASLLLGSERIATQVERQHEVRLLDHLPAVQRRDTGW